ncbi:MAG: sulfurtransferase complex subunit TusB [Methylococcales bacterium]
MLHLVQDSPTENNKLVLCIERAVPGQTILLIEEAVYGARCDSSVVAQVMKGIEVLTICALAPDLEARGILTEETLPSIRRISYEEFVDLAANSKHIHTWL